LSLPAASCTGQSIEINNTYKIYNAWHWQSLTIFSGSDLYLCNLVSPFYILLRYDLNLAVFRSKKSG